MHIFQRIREKVLAVVERLVVDGQLLGELPLHAINAELPKDRSHGDVATNVAMVLAKPAGHNPRALAEIFLPLIEAFEEVGSAEIAGPGFINIRLSKSVFDGVLLEILERGISFGDVMLGDGEKVNLEFVSANPTGPMHIGHVRGAAFGDTLARLLDKAGYDVVREYYINDAGAQVDVLARSAYLRYLEILGEDIGEIPDGYYPGEYLIPVGQALKDTYGNRFQGKEESEWLDEIRTFAIERMLELIKGELSELGITFDVFSSERALKEAGKIDAALQLLTDKGLIYRGVLEPPKGKTPEDWEPREQLLFKATDFGDDVDRPIQKSDGSWTYFAADIAYHLDKYERGFNHMILELGADHGGYLKRLTAAVKALSDNQATVAIKFHQLVNVIQDGEKQKMSKRAGNFVSAREVIDDVGKDIIRFIMLTRKNDAVLDFDFAKVKEQSKDNPVFYVQYAHARACSVLRHAADDAPEAVSLLTAPDSALLAQLNSEDELQLVKQLAEWPKVIEAAAQHLEPHRIAFYLQDLAAGFHGLWNKGNEDALLRFIVPDNSALTAARLVLVKAVSLVIASGLHVFNVEPLEEMH